MAHNLIDIQGLKIIYLTLQVSPWLVRRACVVYTSKETVLFQKHYRGKVDFFPLRVNMHVQETFFFQTSNVLFIVFILKYIMFSTFLFVIHICMEGSEFVLLAAQVQLLAVPQHKNETSVSRFKNGILFFRFFRTFGIRFGYSSNRTLLR